jgi:predicted phosphodiesterase
MSVLLTIPVGAPGRRLIFVGDIHGCFEELNDLLAKVAPREEDLVISVGDMVLKGPDGPSCLELWRKRGYLAVMGNNEEKVLERRDKALLARLLESRDMRQILNRRKLLGYIASWPLAIDFPREGVTAVHGGFLPGTKVSEAAVAGQRRDVVRMRFLRKTNGGWKRISKGQEKPGDVRWPEVWDGERMVVYGHTPSEAARFEGNALGIDTGCVYGGMLTAAIFKGETWEIVTVKARRVYAEN